MLDQAIRRSLKQFVRFIRENGWVGRENEAISLYAFGFLQRECQPGTAFHDPTQIGIEVGAAPSVKKGPRSQTRKDLVIWRQPGGNRWYPAPGLNDPWVIMEWKVCRAGFGSGRKNDQDIEWLEDHCRTHRNTIGYAIWLDLSAPPARARIHRFNGTASGVVEC